MNSRAASSEESEKRSSWNFPDLGRDRRIELVKRLENGAEWSYSFGLLTALSTAIACLGLIQGSTAVVIGAMVVAPLMVPLIAAGLALVQGNYLLFKSSVQTMLRGVSLSMGVALVIGLIIPQSDISSELMARGTPTILDLGVAYFAGFAAAYALALPELLGALAGVAIAVALVPPLASCGIALADARWMLAQGAGLLFLSNTVAIILGAATVFKGFGLQRSRKSADGDPWIRRTIMFLILMGVLLCGPLGYRMLQQLAEGHVRPIAYPLTQEVVYKIEDFLKDHRNIRFVLGGRHVTDGDMTVTIFLSANRAVEQNFRKLFIQEVQNLYHGSPKVEVHIFQEVAGSEASLYQAGPEGIIRE